VGKAEESHQYNVFDRFLVFFHQGKTLKGINFQARLFECNLNIFKD